MMMGRVSMLGYRESRELGSASADFCTYRKHAVTHIYTHTHYVSLFLSLEWTEGRRMWR